MKGDFSRETFQARRHYWGVLRQQGRVDLDADWNEQVRIGHHEHRTRTRDLVGESGGPLDDTGFAITADDDGRLSIGDGRYYVSGILCENDEPAPFDDQPDPPGEPEPSEDGLHLVYLDVWDRHVTAIDDPHIRETALGGPDTSTRGQTVWQVRTRPLDEVPDAVSAAVAAYLEVLGDDEAGDAEAEVALMRVQALVAGAYCEHPLDPVGGSLAEDAGSLAAQASNRDLDADDPCRFEPEGGYRRLENRLYRVEIHDPGIHREGEAGGASFKWSRDNGSVVVPIERYVATSGQTETDRVEVRRLGFDDVTSLAENQFVEIIADDDELAGRPGYLRRILESEADDRILKLDGVVARKDPGLRPKVRRWDMDADTDGQDGDDGETGEGSQNAETGSSGVPVVTDEWIELEDGVEIRFGEGAFRTGDYWLIPARTATADVEWPPFPAYTGEPVDADPEQLPPFGIAHRRAPLAAVVRQGGAVVTMIDLRHRFPGVAAAHTLRYAGGDGQEPLLTDGVLPEPLQVAVTNGDGSVAGSLVRFEIVHGEGALLADATWQGDDGAVTIPTDGDGLASVGWRVDPFSPHHRVRAVMLDACGEELTAPVFFNARVNHQLHYLSGDGQEGTPPDGLTLQPLRVWVSDGQWPLPGATVSFEAGADSGTLDADSETGENGVAECRWTLDPSNPLQQVTARLLDRDGAAVHEAAIVFHARLRRANEVAYEPAGDCVTLQQASTVQQALDELCRRDQGGTCTFAVPGGTDVAALFETIQDSDHVDVEICFAQGVFEVPTALRLADKGHVRVTGAGAATRIIAREGGTALSLAQCASVEVRHLSVEGLRAEGGDEPRGALDVVDCGAVSVEAVRASCGNEAEPQVSGIAVRRREPEVAVGPVRILDCDVVVGEQQTGILVVNADRIHIAGNTVDAGELAEDERLSDFLANPRYRALVRESKLASFAEVDPEVPRGRLTLDRMGEVSIAAGNREITFLSEVSGGTRARIWQEELGEPASARAARQAVTRMANEILLNEGGFGRRQVFRTWFRALERRFAVLGEAGIVVGGHVADDVRIVDNSVQGVLSGVIVALGDPGNHEPHAGVVAVTRNTLTLPGYATAAETATGIMIRDCRSLLIDDNIVRVRSTQEEEEAEEGLLEVAVTGVHINGVLGARMIVRSNHFDLTVVGADISPTESDEDQPTGRRLWLAADNVATFGDMLDAPCTVIEDRNVPPRGELRGEPCPGDRPHGWPG